MHLTPNIVLTPARNPKQHVLFLYRVLSHIRCCPTCVCIVLGREKLGLS